MKTTKRKIISFFVLLFLSFTIILPVYGDNEANEDNWNTGTGTENQENVALDNWKVINAPINKWEVTIRKNIKRVTEVINYNLSDNDKQKIIYQGRYMLPAWMNNPWCNNQAWSSVFFGYNNISCQKFTIEWEWMNEFSKAFFSDVIKTTKYKLLNSEEVSNTWTGSAFIVNKSEEWKEINNEAKIESKEKNIEAIKESNIQNSNSSETSEMGEISEIFKWLDISLDDVNKIITTDWKSLENDVSSFLESESSWKKSEEIKKKWKTKTSTWIVVWDISSWNKLNTSVDRILEKFLDPDEYVKPEKITEESKDEVIKEESTKEESKERAVELSELFPNIYINSDVSNFTQRLFGPEVKNIMYGAHIENGSLAWISANYLAISLEKFRAEKEILIVWGNKIFGLKWFEYYNKSVTDLYEKFLLRNPTILEQKILAKNISAISFSFSTYSNSTINLKTKDVFRNKLILDFQKLEKDYKSISKQNIIRNFLLRR